MWGSGVKRGRLSLPMFADGPFESDKDRDPPFPRSPASPSPREPCERGETRRGGDGGPARVVLSVVRLLYAVPLYLLSL